MLKMPSLAPVLMALPLLFAGCGDTSGDSSDWFGETVASVQKYVTDFIDAHGADVGRFAWVLFDDATFEVYEEALGK